MRDGSSQQDEKENLFGEAKMGQSEKLHFLEIKVHRTSLSK